MVAYEWNFDTNANFGASSVAGTERFKRLNTEANLSAADHVSGGYTVNGYDDIVYLDLEKIHTPDSRFTLQFTIEDRDMRVDVPVNYLAFGYHVRGRRGTCITVGRDTGSRRLTLGTITETGVLKATPVPSNAIMPDSEVLMVANQQYVVTIVFDNSQADERKLMLFSQKVGGAYTSGFLVAASQSMSLKNFSIVQPKIIIGSSAWTNEPDWNGRFDTVHMRIVGKLRYLANEIDDPTFVPGSPYYPVHVSVQNRSYEYANNFRAFTNGQTVRATFYSSYPIAPSSVITTINGISMTLVDTYIVELVSGANGDIVGTTVTLSGDPTKRTSRMYVYEMPVDEAVIGALQHGAIQYRIDMHGNRLHLPANEELTTPYALQKVSDGQYLYPSLIVDRAPPAALDYEITGITLTSVSFVFHSITDPSFIDIVSNYTSYYGYTVVVHAVQQDDPAKHETTTRQDLVAGSSMIIDNLNTDKFYDVYAEVTDPAGATLYNVSPRVSAKFTSPVETIVDEIPPVVTYALPDQPGGGGLIPYRDPADGRAGIRYVASVYDNTARVGRTFAFDLNIYNESVPSITKETVRDGALLTREITANSEALGMLDEVFQSYTVLATAAAAEIIPDETYYVYAYAEDWVPNTTFSQVQSITIENAISNRVAYTESSVEGNVAQSGDKIHLTWTSLYKVPASNWLVTIHGTTITPTTDDGGLSWAAELTISGAHAAGAVQFSVTQTRNTVNNPTSFTHTDVADTLYVENRAPAITSASLVSGLTSVAISSLVFDDYTITHNGMPFDLSLRMDNITDGTTDWTLAETYSQLSAAPLSFSATGLVENRSYVLRANVTNVYQRTTSNIFVDAISTQKDSPVLNLVTNVVNTNVDRATVNVAGTAFMDPTSAVTMYLAIGASDMSIGDTKAMLLATTPVAVDKSAGVLHSVNDLLNDTVLTDYIDQNGASAVLAPKNTAYYVYAMATDGNVDTHAKQPFFVDSVAGLAESLSLTNTSSPQDYFVRGGDTVRLAFDTPLVYADGDFVASMLGQTVNPTSSNGRNWTADLTVPEGLASSYYGPFRFELRVISKYVFDDVALGRSLFVDDGAPSGTLALSQRFNTAFSLTLSALSNAYTQQTPNTVMTVDTNFSVVIKATDADGGTIESAPYSDSYTNVLDYQYRVEGLEESTAYTVTAHVTNPAGTTGVLPLSTATTILTKETELPVMTYTSESFAPKPETTIVQIRNVVANDAKSEFSAYLAIFEDTDGAVAPPLTRALFDDFVANGAGLKVLDRAANAAYTFDGDLTKAVSLSSDGASWSTAVPVRYNAYYRARGLVVDASDNEFVIEVLFQMGGPPVVNYVPPVAVEDESGLSSVTSTSVAFVETDDGTIIGSDSSGGGNHVVVEVLPDSTESPLSTNAVVNAVSLNMSAVSAIDFSGGVSLSDSFTYSTWFLLETPISDAPDEGVDLVQSGGAALVRLTANSVVVESGLRQEFAFTVAPSEWANINVVSDGAAFQVFVDGLPLELIATNEQTITSPGSNLGLNTQAGLLIDDIRIYDAPLNTVQVQKVVQSGQKRLHLGFDTPSIPTFDVTQQNGALLLNGANVTDVLMMSANTKYTFYQYDVSNKEPLVFANKDGTLIDSQNIHYYLDNRHVGSDPIKYTADFSKSTIRRIEIYPVEEFRFGLYSDVSDLPYSVFVNQEPPKVINKANLDEAIVLGDAPPLFVTDSAVGAYAASFPQGDNRSVVVPGNPHSTMNHEVFSLSAWIKTSKFGVNADLPVISRKGAFELGVGGGNMQPYMNLDVDVVMGFVGGLKEVQYSAEGRLSLLEIDFTPPNKTVRYMVFASAQRVVNKRNAFEIAAAFEDSRYVYRAELGEPVTYPLLQLSYVIDATTPEPVPVSLYKSVYVYVLAIDAEATNFELGTENDFKEFVAEREGNHVAHLVEGMRASSTSVEIDTVRFSAPLEVRTHAVWAAKLSLEEPELVRREVTFDADANAYSVNGETAPTITLRTGDTLSLELQGLFQHPMYIKTAQGEGIVGSTHAVLSVSNNGSTVGTVTWTPTTGGEFVYQSASASDVHGRIVVESRIAATSFTESVVESMLLNAGYSEGWNANGAVYYSQKSVAPYQVKTLSSLAFNNALTNLLGNESQSVQSTDQIAIVFVAKTSLGYTVRVHLGNNVVFTDTVFAGVDDNKHNRYANLSDNGRTLIMGYYTNFSESYEHALVPVQFDFSQVGSVWEYEFEMLGDRSKTYPYGFGYVYMYFHGTQTAVRYNSDNVEGWSYFGAESASEWRTVGYPTWQDGTNNTVSTSDQNYEGGALSSTHSFKWPVYHRLTVVEGTEQNVQGYANTRVTLQPSGHTLRFEFFEDAKRLKPVLTGTGAALTHYQTTNPIQYENDGERIAYMTIGYEGQAPSGGGMRVSNFVRIA